MKKLLLICILLISCSSGGSDYDKFYEMDRYRDLVEEYIYLEELSPYEQIAEVRDFIHYTILVENNPIILPYYAHYFTDMINGRPGLCRDMSIHLAAFLQAYGWKFRMVELWAGQQTEDGVEYTHSVIEVWIDDHWEMHDATFNCMISDGDKWLDAEGVQKLLMNGGVPIIDSNGYEQLRFTDDLGSVTYWDHFNIIKYAQTEVF